MVKKSSEADFRSWFRDRWAGWLESYEPRHGSGIGIADIQIVVAGKLVPIELKVGSLQDDRVYAQKVRGVQIGWHKRLNDAGVFTGFLVGCPQNHNAPVLSRFSVFWIDPWDIVDWQKGFDVDVAARKVIDINRDIPMLVNNFLLRSPCRAR